MVAAQFAVNDSASAPKCVSQSPSTMITEAGNSEVTVQSSCVAFFTVTSYQSVSRATCAKAVPQNVSPQRMGVKAGFFGSCGFSTLQPLLIR